MLTPHQGFTYNKFDKPNDWPELSSTFDYKIEDGKLFAANENIKLSGPVGYTVVGSPTISNGIVSGFSSGDYVNTSTNLPISSDEIFVVFITGSNVSTSQVMFSCGDSTFNRTLACTIETGGYFGYGYSEIGDSWTDGYNTTNYLMLANTKYNVSYSFSASTLTVKIKKDTDTSWTEFSKQLNSSLHNSNTYLKFGRDIFNPAKPFLGSIDLNETYIKVNNQLWFGQKYRQCEASNGVVTKNTVPVPEGLVIGNFTTPSNGMFDIVTQTFEPFEYYPIIKTDSNMLQVESKQNVGKVNYTVVGSPTIVNGILSDITNDNYVYVSRSPLTSWSGIELVIATPTTFSTTLTTSTIFGKKDDFYIYANSSGAITLSFVNAGGNYGLHPGNTEYYNRVKKIKLVFGSTTTHRYYTIDGTTWIDAGEIAAIPNFNTYANFTFGSGSYSNAYTGSIDLNNTYIKVNDQVWFGKQKPEAKLVGPVGYTKVGSPTISNGVVSGFDANNYLTLPQPDLSGSFEMFFKFTTPSTWGTAFDIVFSTSGVSFQKQGPNRYLGYYLVGTGESSHTQYNGSHTSLQENTIYYVKIVYNGFAITAYISTDGVTWETDMTANYVSGFTSSTCVFGKNRNLAQQFWNGSIDLNETYIKVNNTLWFGKENWAPCIFDDNSIVEFTGHKADYSSYNTYAFKPTIQNSGTYDVWIDNQKVYENVTSATQTDINWNNLALTTGYSVTTPEALKAHILKITPSNKENKFTAFRHAVSSYTSSGTETTGVLQIYFELDYELELQYLTTQQTSPTTQSRLLYAVTSKTNELITPSLSNSFASTQVRRIPKIKSSDGFTNMSRAFAFIQNSLKYANIDSGLLQYYAFSQSNILEKLDGSYEVGSNAAAVLQQVPALKQLPNITSITTVDLTNFVTKASSLQPTDVDLSNKDDLTKLDIYGTSSYRIDGLKSLKVSNEAPFDSATSPQINVSYTGLDRTALVNLFNSLPYNVGYTVVGTPIIVDGVVSDITSSNRLRLLNSLSFGANDDVEYNFVFTTGQTISIQWLFGLLYSNTWCGIYIDSTGIRVPFTVDNGSTKTCSLTYSLSSSTKYRINVKRVNGTVTSSLYDATDTLIISNTASIPYALNSSNNTIGTNPSYSYGGAWQGSVDLNHAYIKVKGVTWFRGTAAMTKTIDITGCAGTSSLTSDDIAIATNKGWTVTGV